MIRHLDRTGMLAGILNRLRNESVNIEDMETVSGAKAAACDTTLNAALGDKIQKERLANPNIIQQKSSRSKADSNTSMNYTIH